MFMTRLILCAALLLTCSVIAGCGDDKPSVSMPEDAVPAPPPSTDTSSTVILNQPPAPEGKITRK
jgi:predicted small lipoprotein YifL